MPKQENPENIPLTPREEKIHKMGGSLERSMKSEEVGRRLENIESILERVDWKQINDVLVRQEMNGEEEASLRNILPMLKSLQSIQDGETFIMRNSHKMPEVAVSLRVLRRIQSPGFESVANAAEHLLNVMYQFANSETIEEVNQIRGLMTQDELQDAKERNLGMDVS